MSDLQDHLWAIQLQIKYIGIINKSMQKADEVIIHP